MGWVYKTGEHVQLGDRVKISQRYAKEFNVTRDGCVVGLHGFVTVELSNGDNVDLDMRSMSFVRRK